MTESKHDFRSMYSEVSFEKTMKLGEKPVHLRSLPASDSTNTIMGLNKDGVVRQALTKRNMKYNHDKVKAPDGDILDVFTYHGDGEELIRDQEHENWLKIIEQIKTETKTDGKERNIVICTYANINPITKKGLTYSVEDKFLAFFEKLGGVTNFALAQKVVKKTRGALDHLGNSLGLSNICTLVESSGVENHALKPVILHIQIKNGVLVNKCTNVEKIISECAGSIEELDFRDARELSGTDSDVARMTVKKIDFAVMPLMQTRNVRGFNLPEDKWERSALTDGRLTDDALTTSLDSTRLFSKYLVDKLSPLLKNRCEASNLHIKLDHQTCLAAKMLAEVARSNTQAKIALCQEFKIVFDEKPVKWEVFKEAIINSKRAASNTALQSLLHSLSTVTLKNQCNLLELFNKKIADEAEVVREFTASSGRFEHHNPQANFAKLLTKVMEILKEGSNEEEVTGALLKALFAWERVAYTDGWVNISDRLLDYIRDKKYQKNDAYRKQLAQTMYQSGKGPLYEFLSATGGQYAAGFDGMVSGYQPVDNDLIHVLGALKVVGYLREKGTSNPRYLVNTEGALPLTPCKLKQSSNPVMPNDATATECEENSHVLLLSRDKQSICYVSKLSEKPVFRLAQYQQLDSSEKAQFDIIKKRISDSNLASELDPNSEADDKCAKAAFELLGAPLKGSQPKAFFDLVELFLTNEQVYKAALAKPDEFSKQRKAAAAEVKQEASKPLVVPTAKKMTIQLLQGNSIAPSPQEVKQATNPKPTYVDSGTTTESEIKVDLKVDLYDPNTLKSRGNIYSDIRSLRKQGLKPQNLFQDIITLNQAQCLPNSGLIYQSLNAFWNSCVNTNPHTTQQADDLIDLQWAVYDMIMTPIYPNMNPYGLNDIIDRLSSRKNTTCCTKIFMSLFALVLFAALAITAFAILAGGLELLNQSLNAAGIADTLATTAAHTATAMADLVGGPTNLAIAGGTSGLLSALGIAAYTKLNLFRPQTFEACERAKEIQSLVSLNG